MFELINRKPFATGNDYIDQLRLIVAKLGRPSKEDLESFLTSQKAINYILSLPDCVATPFATLCPQHAAETEMLDFLSQLLQFNPHKRMSAEQALSHPFLATMHDPADEPVYAGDEIGTSLSKFNGKESDYNVSRTKLQDLYWAEVQAMRGSLV